MLNSIWIRKISGLVLVLLVMQGCATNPVTGKQDVVLMSEQQEIAMGQKYHKEIMKQYKRYDDPVLQNYVEKIGERLAAKSHRENLIFHFTLLDSPEVNAFALPGGYVYITRGIMAYMTEEAHLAGVLGHEIGHITARHGVRQQTQGMLAGILGAAVAIGTGNRQLAEASNMLGAAIVRGYGRKHELESDRLGAEYIAKNGYDPEDMIDVVGILKNQELFEVQRAREEGRAPRTYHGLFSTHPKNDTRLQEVIRAAEKYRPENSVPPDNGEFLRLTNGMTYGDSEEQGVVRSNAFYHKQLDFTAAFPKGWRIENRPTHIDAISPAGQQLIRVTMEDLSQREDASQFLRRKFKSFGNGRSINTSEDQGYAGTAIIDNPQFSNNVRVAAIYRGKKAFVVYGLGKNSLPDQSFLDVSASIRRLKGSERQLATERRIKTIRAKSGDTFAKLAKKSGLANYPEAQLRLINGMYPTGEPKVGQVIKIVE